MRVRVISCPYRKIGYGHSDDFPFTLIIIPSNVLDTCKLIPGSVFNSLPTPLEDICNVPSMFLDRQNMMYIDTCTDIRPPDNMPYLVGRLLVSSKTIHGANKKKMLKYTFVPETNDYPYYIVASKLARGGTDYYIRMRASDWKSDQRYPIGECMEILGKVGEVSYEEIIVHKYNLISGKRLDYDLVEDDIEYAPLYEASLFSVDPLGCKDIDDVLGWKQTDKKTEISVHIAHATSVCHPDSIHNQFSTIYRPSGRNFNLLPDTLAENKLSLLAGKQRNVISVIMTWDDDCNDAHIRVELHSILNEHAYTYDNVKDSAVYTRLKAWVEDKLFGEKIPDAHKLIEKMMVYTNAYIANELTRRCPQYAILRTSIGFHKYQPAIYMLYKDIQSMNRSTEHTHLGEKYYTHYTSPIRRAVDHTVHLLVQRYILNNTAIEVNDEDMLREKLRVYNKRSSDIKNAESEWFWYTAYKNSETEFEAEITNEQFGYIIEVYLPKFERRATILWCNKRFTNAADFEPCPGKIGTKCILKLSWDLTKGLGGRYLTVTF